MINLKPIFALVITLVLAIATQGKQTTMTEAAAPASQPIAGEVPEQDPVTHNPLANR